MWAGPSTGLETGGLESAQNGCAELDPTYSFFKFWGRARPGPAN
jgi:hypothetical protein